jgi:hypothetical protein
MSYSIIKRKKFAFAGLIWMAVVFGSLYFNSQSGILNPDYSKNIISLLSQLNIYLIPSWILFLFSLDLSRKNRWRYKRK